MKKLFLITLCSIAFVGAKAQNMTDEVAVLQSSYGLDKKQLIVQHMKFTEAESAKFWSVYDKYEADRKDLGKKRIANITEYAKNYDNMSDEKATELVNAALENQMAFTKLQQKTFKEMSTAISPLRAAQFIQLEVYLETLVRKTIADEIPLIHKVSATEKKN